MADLVNWMCGNLRVNAFAKQAVMYRMLACKYLFYSPTMQRALCIPRANSKSTCQKPNAFSKPVVRLYGSKSLTGVEGVHSVGEITPARATMYSHTSLDCIAGTILGAGIRIWPQETEPGEFQWEKTAPIGNKRAHMHATG